jgi:N-acetylmuramoyl-L-alanine amidase
MNMRKTLLCLLFTTTAIHPISIMLDPAGDARTTGRAIGEQFERTVAFNCATALKSVLEQLGPNVRVIVSRVPQETVVPLQNANFANRLTVDLFVSINCYQDNGQRPTLYLYYMQYHPLTDKWNKQEQLAFYPYDQAYLGNMSRSTHIADLVARTLSNSKTGEIKGPFGIPCKPLLGVQSPSLAFEIGCNNNNWQALIHPLAQALMGCFT